MKNMTQDRTNSERTFTKMLIGGAVGFVLGFLIKMLVNPPFSGITKTSSDVQGLIYFTWFGLGVVGGVLGTLAGLVDIQKLRGNNHKAKRGNKA